VWTESERVKVLNVLDVLEMEESDERDEELFNRFGGVLRTAEDEDEDEDEALLAAG
jgi:hypothetical protein